MAQTATPRDWATACSACSTTFAARRPPPLFCFPTASQPKALSLADAAEEARRKGVPLFAIGLGRDSPPRDIELADVLVDDVVFANDLVSLQAQIKASGLEGQSRRRSRCGAKAWPSRLPSKRSRCRLPAKRSPCGWSIARPSRAK